MESKSTTLCDISFDQIVRRLLKEGLNLTALELFAELTENGKELPSILKDFVNSFNDCDLNSTFLERSNSLQTFDSLDLTRSSDDGEKSWERIAVLEFELRKAKETINSLRETLTVNVISQNDTKYNFRENSDLKLDSHISVDLIKPQEKRTINYLINDYLLKQNYKLTSITFSEENENQDFDDWSDVGLNITKPPDLLYFYRFYWLHFNQFQDKTSSDQLQSNQPTSDNLYNCSFQIEAAKDNHTTFDAAKENVNDHFENDYNHKKEVIDLNQVKALVTSEASQPVKVDESCQTEFGVSTKLDLINSESVSTKDNNKMDTSIPEFDCDVIDLPRTSFNLTTLKKSLSSLNYLGGLELSKLSQEEIYNDDSRVAISMLSHQLPQIVANLPNQKKCTTIPLLIAAILFNQCKAKRDDLLRLLYTLIKKPNPDQRKMISTGLVCLASNLNCNIILGELFANFLEDIESKTIERRLLVTECISNLIPFVSPELRSSALLSMLRSLVQDHDSDVKKLSYNSLAILVSLIFENGQFDKMSEVVSIFLNAIEAIPNQDTDNDWFNFSEILFNTLLPPIAMGSFKSNNFEDIFLAHLIAKITEYSEKEDKRATFLQFLTCFNLILPFIFAMVIKDAPPSTSFDTVLIQDVQAFQTFLNQTFDLRDLISDHQIQSYLSHINKEWFKTWNQLNWILDYVCDTFLFRVITGLNCDLAITKCVCEIFQKLSQFLGVSLTRIKLKNLFLKHLNIYGSSDEISDDFTNSLLPIYFNAIFLSHSCIFQDVEEVREMTKCLQIGLMNVSLFNYSLVSFEMTIAIVAQNKSSQGINFFISFLRKSFTNSNPFIRRNVANIYKILIESTMTNDLISDDILIESILSSLTALSTDVDIQVRASSISAFGSFLVMKRYRLTRKPSFNPIYIQKVNLQLQAYFEDQISRDSHLIKLELIKMINKVISSIECSENDFDVSFIRFVIPILSAFAAQTAQMNSSQKTKKQDILLSLLETYGLISKISNQVLIDQSIEEAILPALRCVKDQLLQVAPDYKEESILLINEFERRAILDNLNRMAATNSKASRSNLASSFSLPQIGASTYLNSSLGSSIMHNQMVDDVKSKVKGILNRSSSISTAAKANIANIFKRT